MKAGDRLVHLRVLLNRLERMPASADRDWMLSEVRARAVDVETGVTPAKVRALPVEDAPVPAVVTPAKVRALPVEGAPVPAVATPVRRKPAPSRRAAETVTRLVVPITPSSLVAVRARARHDSAVDLLQPGELLCLGDSSADSAAATRPWVCGLRG
jgi:hypothetical protein